MMTDAQLLEEYRDRQSDDAFSTLVARHAGWVYAVARRRVHDEHLAHDVTQAVFVLLTERASRIRHPERLNGWLMQTTIHAANHAIRGERRRRDRENATVGHRPTISGETDLAETSSKSEEVAEVENAVNRLNDQDRAAIVHRFHQGRSVNEVARELGINADTARKRIDRALQRLRKILEARGIGTTQCSGLLAGLLSMNKPNYMTNIRSAGALRSGATGRTLSIKQGVNRMRQVHRIKMAATATVVLLTTAGGLLWAAGPYSEGGQGDKPPVAQVVAPPAVKPAATAADSGRANESAGLIVVVSPDRKKMTGYAKRTGVVASIDGQDFDITKVMISDGLAAYHGTNRVYAFSSMTGTWDSIAVPGDSTYPLVTEPAVSTDAAAVSVPGFVHAFSATTGKWISLPTTEDRAVEPFVETDTVKVMTGDRLHFFSAKTGKWTDGL